MADHPETTPVQVRRGTAETCAGCIAYFFFAAALGAASTEIATASV